MTNAVLRFTSAVIVLLAMLACGPGAQTGEVTHLDADWAILYHDLGQLKLASDLAVAGTFTSMSGQTEQTGIPYSDFVLTVNRTIYDPKHRPSTSTVLVHQTGGTVNGQTIAASNARRYEATLALRLDFRYFQSKSEA